MILAGVVAEELAGGSGGPITYAFRQAQNLNGAVDTTSGYGYAYASNVVAGNLLIAFQYTQGATPTTPSDTAGNTWLPLGVVSYGSGYTQYTAAWYAIANASGPLTVTLHGDNFDQVGLAEYAVSGGVPYLDASTTNTAASSSVSASVTASTSQPLVIAVIAVGGTGTPSGDSYTDRGFAPNFSSTYLGLADVVSSGSGTKTATWSISGYSGIVLAAFGN